MLRKTVSLTLAWMFLIAMISGLALFVSPPGRIAHWADWTLLGLDKSGWEHLHEVTTLLMIIAVIFHLFFNWRPILSYMKDKATKALTLTKELALSLVITLMIAASALLQLPPLRFLIDIGDTVSESWERSYGTPPYPHAELDTIQRFCEKTGIDPETAKARLSKQGIPFDAKTTLLDIATRQGISPQTLFQRLQGETATSVKQGMGLGKKTLAQLCELRGLDVDAAIMTLKAHGVEADKDDKFKTIAEKQGIHPSALLEMIEG